MMDESGFSSRAPKGAGLKKTGTRPYKTEKYKIP